MRFFTDDATPRRLVASCEHKCHAAKRGFFSCVFRGNVMKVGPKGTGKVVCVLLTKLDESPHFSRNPLDPLANDVYDYVTNGTERSTQRATNGGRVSLVHNAKARCVRAGFSFIRHR